jgi:hypothetical protein
MLGPGLSFADFGSVTRLPTGKPQLTYKAGRFIILLLME